MMMSVCMLYSCCISLIFVDLGVKFNVAYLVAAVTAAGDGGRACIRSRPSIHYSAALRPAIHRGALESETINHVCNHAKYRIIPARLKIVAIIPRELSLVISVADPRGPANPTIPPPDPPVLLQYAITRGVGRGGGDGGVKTPLKTPHLGDGVSKHPLKTPQLRSSAIIVIDLL